MPQSQNLILNALPADVFAALQPDIRESNLSFEQVLCQTRQAVVDVHFPNSAVVSLVTRLQDGRMIEAAMVGRDGVVNGTCVLNGRVSLHECVVQVAGTSSAISPGVLHSAARKFESLHSMIIRHEQVLLSQAMQSAACNASHTVEERLARWLLRLRDLTRSEQLTLTQEYLAQLLGVRRTTVSLVAGNLQRAGLISYRRGHIKLMDVEALKDASCECYEKVRVDYELLGERGI
jgi:Crp-like helix-turn-helix protein